MQHKNAVEPKILLRNYFRDLLFRQKELIKFGGVDLKITSSENNEIYSFVEKSWLIMESALDIFKNTGLHIPPDILNFVVKIEYEFLLEDLMAKSVLFVKNMESIKTKSYSLSGCIEQYSTARLERLEIDKLNSLDYLLEQISARCKLLGIGSNIGAFINDEISLLLSCIIQLLEMDNKKCSAVIPILMCNLLDYSKLNLNLSISEKIVQLLAVDGFKTFIDESAFGSVQKEKRIMTLKYIVSVYNIKDLPKELQAIADQTISLWMEKRVLINDAVAELKNLFKELEIAIGKNLPEHDNTFPGLRFYDEDDENCKPWKVYRDLLEKHRLLPYKYTPEDLIRYNDDEINNVCEMLKKFNETLFLAITEVKETQAKEKMKSGEKIQCFSYSKNAISFSDTLETFVDIAHTDHSPQLTENNGAGSSNEFNPKISDGYGISKYGIMPTSKNCNQRPQLNYSNLLHVQINLIAQNINPESQLTSVKLEYGEMLMFFNSPEAARAFHGFCRERGLTSCSFDGVEIKLNDSHQIEFFISKICKLDSSEVYKEFPHFNEKQNCIIS